ncbi:MAG TPA: hypothetical protein DET40_24370 [Lentisphaeria bacterium]|nr:MAG: hypothetical protein A2X45_00125 [Lentisphaerae bacterium GWF2_50_93]HCE46695.1 hypothetical protein [Lentisphaeria bacterium]
MDSNVTLSLQGRNCISFLNMIQHRVMLTSPDRKVVFANIHAEKSLGGHIRGMRCYNVIHDTEMPSKNCAECTVYLGGVSGCTRLGACRRDTKVGKVHALPISGSDNVVSNILYVFDSTVDEAESIRKAFDTKVLYARGVLHDLNNLLASTRLNAEAARLNTAGDPLTCGILDSCISASGKSAHLVRNLVSFLRDDSDGHENMDMGPVDIEDIIRDSAGLFLDANDVRFTMSSQLGNGFVRGDRIRLFQLFNNLFINAREARPKDLVVTATLSWLTLADGNTFGLAPGKYAGIAVADNGCGIAKEHISHIFDPYFTMKKTGSGLGLSICHRIALGDGGAISAESEPGA